MSKQGVFERLEAGSYRLRRGEAVYAIELWFGQWEVFALHRSRLLTEVPVLARFQTLKAARQFIEQESV